MNHFSQKEERRGEREWTICKVKGEEGIINAVKKKKSKILSRRGNIKLI